MENTKKEIVFLDTETTGLFNADAIEICVVSLKNNGKKSILFNKLIKTKKQIDKKALAVHGINKEMLKADGVSFKKIYKELKEVLSNKLIIVYNLNFDFNIINNMCLAKKLDPFLDYNNGFCAMRLFAQIFGEFNDYFNDYKYQKLSTAFNYYNPKINKHDKNLIVEHRALGDCLMTKYIFKEILKKAINNNELNTKEMLLGYEIANYFKKELIKNGAKL